MDVVYGDMLELTGVSVDDANGGGADSDRGRPIALEVSCEHGHLDFAHFDDHELKRQASRNEGTTRTLALKSDLKALNRALRLLQYTSDAAYHELDTVRVLVRNDAVQPAFIHQREIRVRIRPKVLVPSVELNSTAYTTFEDTSFRFPDLVLRFSEHEIESALPASASYDSFLPSAIDRMASGDTVYEMSISVTTGTIISSKIKALRDGAAPSSTFSVRGTYARLREILGALEFLPSPNWNSQISRQPGQAVEWLFTVKYGQEERATYADLIVLPRADAPVIQVPEDAEQLHAYRSMSDFLSKLRLTCRPLRCEEDTPTSLRGLAVRSADSGRSPAAKKFTRLRVSLSVSHGTLAFSNTKCVTQSLRVGVGAMKQEPQKRVSFEADVACANLVLASGSYTGDPHFSGLDSLTVRVVNIESSASDEVAIPLHVVEINDAPYLVSGSQVYECDEDTPLVIRDFRIVDPDANAATITAVIRAAFGSLALLEEPFTPFAASVTTTDDTKNELLVKGTLHDVNSALAALVYTSANNWNSVDSTFDAVGDGYDTITVTVSDSTVPSLNSTTTSVRFIFVNPLADSVTIRSPRNTPTSDYADEAPGMIHGDEDTTVHVHDLSFSSVDDVSRISLTITLRAAHGVLTLSSLSGITFEDNTSGSGLKRIRCKGTFPDINTSVRALRYRPDADFHGLDEIRVSAFTFDEYTMEESQETSLVVQVRIDAVNDPPVWDLRSVGHSAVIVDPASPTLLRGVQFSDVDVAEAACVADPLSCEMELVVEVAHGSITLPRMYEQEADSVALRVRTLVQDRGYLALAGTLKHLNVVLAEIIFELDDIEGKQEAFRELNEVGLVLSIDDRGTFGKGGPHVSTAVIYMALAAHQSQLRLSVIAPADSVLSVAEDSLYTFSGSSLRIYDADVTLSAASLLEMTISTPHGTFALALGVPGIQRVANHSGVLVFRGFLRQINSALNGSAYLPAPDWYGSEQVVVSVVDIARSYRSASATVYLAVTPQCDEPTWRASNPISTARDEFASVREDEKLFIDSLSLSCPDAEADEREITLRIHVYHGGVMLATYQGLLLLADSTLKTMRSDDSRFLLPYTAVESAVTSSRLFFSHLEVRGRIEDINAALRGMIYEPDLDFNSNGDLVTEIQLTASSSCGARGGKDASSMTLRLRVHAVNDAPVVKPKDFVLLPSSLRTDSFESIVRFLPAPALEVAEDADLQLDALLVEDPDNADANGCAGLLQLQLNISCYHCSIRPRVSSSYLREQLGLFIAVDPEHPSDSASSAKRVLSVQGSLEALNAGFLSFLVFRSAADFHGLALIVLEVSDLGNFGHGGAQVRAYAQAVRVHAVNDGPEIHLPPYGASEPLVRIQEGESVLLHGAPSVDELVASDRGQQRLALQDRIPKWHLMLAQPLAADSDTRLRILHSFPGSDATATGFFVTLRDSSLLFRGRTEPLGDELWLSDGTEVGTAPLMDIFPGPEGSEPSHLIVYSADNRAYFSARGPDFSWRVLPDQRDACQSFRQSAYDADVFYGISRSNTWEPDQVHVLSCLREILSRSVRVWTHALLAPVGVRLSARVPLDVHSRSADSVSRHGGDGRSQQRAARVL